MIPFVDAKPTKITLEVCAVAIALLSGCATPNNQTRETLPPSSVVSCTIAEGSKTRPEYRKRITADPLDFSGS